jgi:hypothetical protein
MRSAHFPAPCRLQNKRAGKPHGSLPLITVGCCHCPTPNWSSPPIAYTSYSLAMPPIFSNVPCIIVSVNRLNSAIMIIASVYHFQRVVKSCQGFGFTLDGLMSRLRFRQQGGQACFSQILNWALHKKPACSVSLGRPWLTNKIQFFHHPFTKGQNGSLSVVSMSRIDD